MSYITLTFRSVACVALLLAPMTAAAATSEEKFKSAYAAYQQHIAANETKQARASAKVAYQVGTKLFGKTSVNTANLANNYAALLNDTGEFKKARKTLKGQLQILEQRYGSSATQLVPMLFELGRANFDAKAPPISLDYFQRAATLAENHDNPIYAAKRNFDIATTILNLGYYPGSEPFMRRAYEIYSEHVEPSDFRLGLTSYQMAIWAMTRQQNEQAIAYLNGSLTSFRTNDGNMGDLERTVRYRLVETYERMGLRDAATEHCLALGASQAWSLPPAPVFGTKAAYPQAAIDNKLSGEVQLAFTIDENGYVNNPTVAESSDAVFDESALEMIRQHRFAPRFENGEPVATAGVQVTATFDIGAINSGGLRANFQRPPERGFLHPDLNDPSVCGDPNDAINASRCSGFGGAPSK
jgi:TonB family protein